MAFKNLVAFGAGELTPELWERGNLDKFRTGLMTLRNATVTKMGGLKSRAGTKLLHATKSNARAKFLYIQSKNYLLEFTNGNLRVKTGYDPAYDTFASTADLDLSLFPVMSDITTIHFTHGNRYLFVFRETYETIRIDLDKVISDPSNAVSSMYSNVDPYNPWVVGTSVSYTAGGSAPTGYTIDYAVTFVYDGVETYTFSIDQTRNKPISTGQSNTIAATITKASLPAGTPLPDELRVYQRPRDGGGFLYVGNATAVEGATTAVYTFKDFSVTPDPLNLPPEFVAQFKADSKTVTGTPGVYDYPIKAKTGLVYQDRLVFSGSQIKNRIFGSRTGTTAMTRDFPLQSDSAVSFAAGSDGGQKVNRFFDGRGLMIFTTVGVYETPANLLTPETAYGVKRGPYIADENIEPLQLGGYIVIYDKRLKAVIGLIPSGNQEGLDYNELSIYSAHLLKGKTITSWDLQDAETQVLWQVLSDGTFLSFSFQNEQLVRSWARHDIKDGLVEEIFVMDTADYGDIVCACVNRNGSRYVERLTPRDAEFIDFVGTDSSVVYKENVLKAISAASATIAPVSPGVWDGSLTITPISGSFTQVADDIVRVFIDTWEYIDLTVTANTLGVLTVTPSVEFPSAFASLNQTTNILWKVFKGDLTGLTHLNGKKVSVRIDGFTHASPLNTVNGYTEYTVASNKITLGADITGSHISVGLPIVTDIQTLEVDTVEQAPIKLDDKIVNKLWLSYFESLFLFAGSSLPDDDTITGMENQEFQVEPDDGILNTIPPLPITERLEMQMEGDWKVKGSVALRNVDPQPIGLLAIIPDIEVT